MKKHLILERGILLVADSQLHTISTGILFYEIRCSLVTEKIAMEKNSEISFHLVVLHATLPHLTTERLNWSFMCSKGKTLARAIKQYPSCLRTTLLAIITSPKHVQQPRNERTNAASTCKSLACYKVGSSPISDELSYLGSQSTEILHPRGSVCGHCDNSEIF